MPLPAKTAPTVAAVAVADEDVIDEPPPLAAAPIAQRAREACHCDNCGSPIGRLETPRTWNGHTVCIGCYSRLAVPIQYAAPNTPRTAAPSQQPVTIEQTSKTWKGMMLVGLMLFLAGAVFSIMIAMSPPSRNRNMDALGTMLCLGMCGVGLLTYIVARFRAWWDNG